MSSKNFNKYIILYFFKKGKQIWGRKRKNIKNTILDGFSYFYPKSKILQYIIYNKGIRAKKKWVFLRKLKGKIEKKWGSEKFLKILKKVEKTRSKQLDLNFVS